MLLGGAWLGARGTSTVGHSPGTGRDELTRRGRPLWGAGQNARRGALHLRKGDSSSTLHRRAIGQGEQRGATALEAGLLLMFLYSGHTNIQDTRTVRTRKTGKESNPLDRTQKLNNQPN